MSQAHRSKTSAALPCTACGSRSDAAARCQRPLETIEIPVLLRKSEAARALRYVSTKSIERLISRGELTAVALNQRQVRVLGASLAAFIERRTAAAGAGAGERVDTAPGRMRPVPARGAQLDTIMPRRLGGGSR